MFWEEKISSCQHVILNVDTLNLNFTCQFLSRYDMPWSWSIRISSLLFEMQPWYYSGIFHLALSRQCL
jgi:hypothetical protein